MSEFLKQNAIQVIEGHTVTTSRIVSEYFGKKHSDVVRAITSIVANFPAGQASRNFAQWSEEVEIGGGAKRRVNGYLMDRKGFCLLAMGFTGKEALKFKIAFYDEFERMENALRNQNSVANTDRKLNTKEQYELRKAVKSRALTNSIHYQTIYNALYDYFKIASYKDLRSDQLQSAITFINACELRPQLPPPSSASRGCACSHKRRSNAHRKFRLLLAIFVQAGTRNDPAPPSHRRLPQGVEILRRRCFSSASPARENAEAARV